MVEEDGFEPSKSVTTDLQSAPFGHSGTLPCHIKFIRDRCRHPTMWSWWTDLNPRPADYKSAALPTELHQHVKQRKLYYHKSGALSISKKQFF